MYFGIRVYDFGFYLIIFIPTIGSALKNKTPLTSLFALLFITATATFTKAQEFGGNPPSIKWQQVNIPAAKVIFPKGLDSAAYAVASIIARMNYVIEPTIGTKQKQISIVLQNQTTIANACLLYTSPSPRDRQKSRMPSSA